MASLREPLRAIASSRSDRGGEMRRVVVIGCGGAGKSTFATRLAQITGLPLVHLDVLFWTPGWVSVSAEEFDRQLAPILPGEQWIMDGNYLRTLDWRLEAADTAIFLDMPRWLCLWRVVWRRFRYWGRTRPDMAEGCTEQIDREFLKWIWDFPKDTRPKVLEMLQAARNCRTIVLRSPREVESFLSNVRAQKGLS